MEYLESKVHLFKGKIMKDVAQYKASLNKGIASSQQQVNLCKRILMNDASKYKVTIARKCKTWRMDQVMPLMKLHMLVVMIFLIAGCKTTAVDEPVFSVRSKLRFEENEQVSTYCDPGGEANPGDMCGFYHDGAPISDCAFAACSHNTVLYCNFLWAADRTGNYSCQARKGTDASTAAASVISYLATTCLNDTGCTGVNFAKCAGTTCINPCVGKICFYKQSTDDDRCTIGDHKCNCQPGYKFNSEGTKCEENACLNDAETAACAVASGPGKCTEDANGKCVCSAGMKFDGSPAKCVDNACKQVTATETCAVASGADMCAEDASGNCICPTQGKKLTDESGTKKCTGSCDGLSCVQEKPACTVDATDDICKCPTASDTFNPKGQCAAAAGTTGASRQTTGKAPPSAAAVVNATKLTAILCLCAVMLATTVV